MWAALKDLSFATRVLVRNRSFTLTVLILLTLSIGTISAIFSFVSGILLRPLPIRDPEQVVVLNETNLTKDQLRSTVSPRNLEDWERESKTIAHFGAWRDWHFRITTPEGPEGVSSAIASPGLFDVLGLQPVLGRPILPVDNTPGQDNVILISYRFWQTYFGGSSSVIGMSLNLDNKSFAVVGVLPVDMDGLSLGRFDVWAPVSVDPDQNLGRHVRNRQVYARLKNGVSISEAQSEMTAIAGQLAETYPKEDKEWGVTMRSLYVGEVGSVRPALLTFFGAVAFVLLIACANIANLQLARAAKRRKELAIRTALGASRFQLIRQLLVENVVLAISGGCCGLILASWAIDLFVALTPRGVPRLQQVRIDGKVLAFTLLVTLTTGILYGLAPAVQSSRINLTESLKEAQKFSGRGGLGLQNLLVICQIALALILLVGAGLLSRSFLRLTTLDPGFNPKNLLTVQMFPPASKYKSGSQVAEFYLKAIQELKLIPGVTSVGASSAGPQFGGWEPVEILLGGVASPAGEYPQVRYYDVGPDYFKTMEIPIRKGREFTDTDNQNAPPVAMINETLARRYWPNEDPTGKRLNLARRNKSMEIIGVVGDVQRFDADSKIEPEIYWPYLQEPRWATYFVLRTDSDATGAAFAIRKQVIGLDKDVFVSSVRPMDRLISSSLQDPRFNVLVIGIFAFLALLLASVGLYAVVSYSVVQRTREIGIRIALGAERRDIINLIIKRGIFLAMIGLSIGLVCSLVLTRFISSLLFGISPTDSAALLGVTLLLLSVAVIASYIPARRATRIDPIAALRHA